MYLERGGAGMPEWGGVPWFTPFICWSTFWTSKIMTQRCHNIFILFTLPSVTESFSSLIQQYL